MTHVQGRIATFIGEVYAELTSRRTAENILAAVVVGLIVAWLR